MRQERDGRGGAAALPARRLGALLRRRLLPRVHRGDRRGTGNIERRNAPMRFTLRRPEGTCTFCKITSGKKWVGRVTQHADGTWIGVIGKLMVTGHRSREDAFDAVVAKHLGYDSADELRARNAA